MEKDKNRILIAVNLAFIFTWVIDLVKSNTIFNMSVIASSILYTFLIVNNIICVIVYFINVFRVNSTDYADDEEDVDN